jgi:hypothetical protein
MAVLPITLAGSQPRLGHLAVESLDELLSVLAELLGGETPASGVRSDEPRLLEHLLERRVVEHDCTPGAVDVAEASMISSKSPGGTNFMPSIAMCRTWTTTAVLGRRSTLTTLTP